MIAALFVKIRWYKENRSPKGSLERKEFLRQAEGKGLSPIPGGEGEAYVKSLCFVQRGDEIAEEERLYGKREDGFYPLAEAGIPNVEIAREGDSYRVKWFDDESGNVRRRGGNEDYGKRGAKLARYPNRLNETAFLLGPGQSGRIRWNNRFTSYHGQWYEQYQAYFVNTEKLEENLFIRRYEFEYEQMADLF